MKITLEASYTSVGEDKEQLGRTYLRIREVGTFTQDLYDEAKKDGWIVVSMKKDWKRIFPFE